MHSHTLTEEETAIMDGEDDASRDELRRDLHMRFRNDSRGDVEISTHDGILLFVVPSEQD